MTLESYEKVFQSDLMRVPPLADAMGFGLIGNWVLNGLQSGYTGLNFSLSAGKAILGGRVFFLNQLKTWALSTVAGTYYCTLTQDISMVNTEDANGNVTNNQFTLQIKAAGDMIWGDVVGGDLQSDFPFYKIVTDGSKITNVTKLIYPYYSSKTYVANGEAVSNTQYTFKRMGNLVTVSCPQSSLKVRTTASGTVMNDYTIDDEYKPDSLVTGTFYCGNVTVATLFIQPGTGGMQFFGMTRLANLVSSSNPTVEGSYTSLGATYYHTFNLQL